MLHLVTGGSGSGKSAYAEDVICRCHERMKENRLVYIATMIPYGGETKKKIQRHRDLRAHKGFVTRECYTDLKGLALDWELQSPSSVSGGCVLLECMSNLTANELYEPGGAGEYTAGDVMEGIRLLRDRCACLVIVTNEVFGECAEDSEEMQRYKRVLAQINVRTAAMADHVTEVVCGVPFPIKGSAMKFEKKDRREEEAANMKFITGGAYQGKRAYAERAYGVKSWADGGVCPLDAVFSCEGIYHFEQLIGRMMEAKLDMTRLTGEIARRNPEIVIVSTEIGCGLVPAEEFLRAYREQTGRICTELAASSVRVDRVVCGMAVRLKGGTE